MAEVVFGVYAQRRLVHPAESVAPLHGVAVHFINGIASWRSVHTLLGAPPCATSSGSVVLIEAVAKFQVHIEVGVPRDEVGVIVFEDVMKLAYIGEQVGVEAALVQIGIHCGGNVEEDKHQCVFIHSGEVLFEPTEGVFGHVGDIVYAVAGVEIVVDENNEEQIITEEIVPSEQPDDIKPTCSYCKAPVSIDDYLKQKK